MEICVIGLGYIGLPTAALLATHGFDVTGVDINRKVVERTNAGVTTIKEKNFVAILRSAVSSGKLKAQMEVPKAEAYMICVPTPFSKADKSATLRYVEGAGRSISPVLRKGSLVILESTVPPGTTEETLLPILEESGLRCGEFHLAHCPERLLPGNLVHEIINNDRVIGGVDEESARAAKKIYKRFVRGEIFITNARTAEFVKLMENTFGTVNIALANEFAKIAERLGIDCGEAMRLANRHPRVKLFKPGPGVGGHCLPVDPWFIVEKVPEEARLIRTALEVNEGMPLHVIKAVEEVFAREGKRLKGARIALLGATYKGDVGDTRESPSMVLLRQLAERGCAVTVHDPLAEEFPLRLERDVLRAVNGCDALIIVTDHTEYKKLGTRLDEIRKSMRGRMIFDARNLLTSAEGFTLWKLGSGVLKR
ncbi:MAG: nucleotide sugar dehydrogenase [Candidatus Thermoplasmatota archaeon]